MLNCLLWDVMVLQLTLTVWAGKTLQVQANLIDSHLADMNMNDC